MPRSDSPPRLDLAAPGPVRAGHHAAEVAVPPVTRPAANGRPRRDRHWNRAAWLLVSPAGIVLLAFTVAPIAFLIFTSFTDYGQRTLFTGRYEFVGGQQYSSLVVDPEFWWALLRSVLFTTAMVAGSVAVGLGVARLLARLATAMRTVVTLALILAWAMPTVASSLVWKWLFQPGYGVVNWLLTQTGLFGDLTNTDWANDPSLAYVAIWLLVVWQAVPFIALTLYAALTQMPAELQSAARLDGAGEWRVWWSITVPFLRPTLLLVTLMSVIWDFNVFNQIWILTKGGPDGATTTIAIWSFTKAFASQSYGQGAAIAVFSVVLLAVLVGWWVRRLVVAGEES
jgi:N,N'-diacetylchitobiose transport system permease protein